MGFDGVNTVRPFAFALISYDDERSAGFILHDLRIRHVELHRHLGSGVL